MARWLEQGYGGGRTGAASGQKVSAVFYGRKEENPPITLVRWLRETSEAKWLSPGPIGRSTSRTRTSVDKTIPNVGRRISKSTAVTGPNQGSGTPNIAYGTSLLREMFAF